MHDAWEVCFEDVTAQCFSALILFSVLAVLDTRVDQLLDDNLNMLDPAHQVNVHSSNPAGTCANTENNTVGSWDHNLEKFKFQMEPRPEQLSERTKPNVINESHIKSKGLNNSNLQQYTEETLTKDTKRLSFIQDSGIDLKNVHNTKINVSSGGVPERNIHTKTRISEIGASYDFLFDGLDQRKESNFDVSYSAIHQYNREDFAVEIDMEDGLVDEFQHVLPDEHPKGDISQTMQTHVEHIEGLSPEKSEDLTEQLQNLRLKNNMQDIATALKSVLSLNTKSQQKLMNSLALEEDKKTVRQKKYNDEVKAFVDTCIHCGRVSLFSVTCTSVASSLAFQSDCVHTGKSV